MDDIAEYRRRAIAMLRNYNRTQTQLRMAQADLRALEDMYSSGMAVRYDQPAAGQTYKITSVTEDEALDLVERRDRLRARMARLSGELERIDIALSGMPRDYAELLRLRYADGLYWYQVAQRMHYSEGHLKTVMDGRAVGMLAGHLFTEVCRVGLFGGGFE